MEALIIQLISGAAGGNLAGKAMPQFDLGLLWNSVAGVIGGGIGAQIIGAVIPGMFAGGFSVNAIIASIASGGVGGAALLVLAGIVKSMTNK